jgi:hypothetical protein
MEEPEFSVNARQKPPRRMWSDPREQRFPWIADFRLLSTCLEGIAQGSTNALIDFQQR